MARKNPYYNRFLLAWVYINENCREHREDGPAVEYLDGTKVWYIDGKMHREDGPAVIYPSGKKYWRKNGKLHREDGPAVIKPDGTIEWYLKGQYLNFENWIKKVNLSDSEITLLKLTYIM